MVLKRKRSESELSFSSAFSSPPRPGSSGGGGFDFSAMEIDNHQRVAPFPLRVSTPSHLPSRTFKRFRDNRPSEAIVHQHTLQMLYSAQQQQQPQPQQQLVSPQASSPAPLPPARASGPGIKQQRSLHAFWSLPSPSSPASSSSSVVLPPSPQLTAQQHEMASNCEDCGAGLVGNDDMMDIDGCGTSEGSCCETCGKAVCFSCSVGDLGEERRCLACAVSRSAVAAGKRSWIERGWAGVR